MNQSSPVGFSQRVRLGWLEQTADLKAMDVSPADIRVALYELLSDQLSVGRTTKNGNIKLAVSILMKSWVLVPPTLIPLRDDGLKLLQRLPAEDHLAVHWGMVSAVYPFFALEAESIGRLLRLQQTVSQTQVLRRMYEHFGQRDTVKRAAQRVLRCLVDWQVLEDAGTRGAYRNRGSRTSGDYALSAWLIEIALMNSGARMAPVKTLVHHPALFPFRLEASHAALQTNRRLDWFRQGLDEDMVALVGNR